MELVHYCGGKSFEIHTYMGSSENLWEINVMKKVCMDLTFAP